MRTRFWTMGLVVGLLVLATAGLCAGTALASSWLGVYSQEITPELREGMNYNGSGVLIRSVVRDSPAERAGLERGDVIVRVGTRDIRNPAELSSAVRAMESGRRVSIELVRDGRRRVLDATLEERPADTGDDSGEESEDDRGTWERRAPVPAPAPMPSPRTPAAPEAPRMHGLDDFDFQIPDVMALAGRGRLGVRIESLNPDLASYFGGRDVRGALVLDVTEDSPADRAGIRAGDVITRVNSSTVADADDLIGAIRDSETDATITLIRHGSQETVEARLGDAPKSNLMRLRGGPEGFQWRTRDGKRVREWTWDGDSNKSETKTPRRIVIRGDEPEDQNLRRELEELREELRQLREELRNR